MINFGKPRDNINKGFTSLRELPDCQKTGFYEMVIASVSIKEIVSKKNGRTFQKFTLGLAIMQDGEPVERVYYSGFFGKSSQVLQDICWFAGFVDKDGSTYCPDITEVAYDDPVSGSMKSFNEIKELKNVHIYGIVTCTGEGYTGTNGVYHPNYELEICNAQGQTAAEASMGAMPFQLKSRLDALKVNLAQGQTQAAQPQQQTYGSGPVAQAVRQVKSQEEKTKTLEKSTSQEAVLDDDIPF
jgi:hypothetical protein